LACLQAKAQACLRAAELLAADIYADRIDEVNKFVGDDRGLGNKNLITSTFSVGAHSRAPLPTFPQETQENLADGSQQIFITAFNRAVSDGLDEEAATNVAWNTVKHDYEKGADGKWHFRQHPDTGIHHKAITTGGN